jgi:tryptophan-rich sensory protein
VIAVFISRRPAALKFRQLKIAVGIFILLQIALYVLCTVVFYFIEDHLGKEGSITFASAIIWTTVAGALVAALWFSNKAIKRITGQSNAR